MSDRHLVLDGAKFVVSSFLDFSVAEPGEISFDFGADVVYFPEVFGIAWDICSGIIGYIQIFSASIFFSSMNFGLAIGHPSGYF